jgi:predicted GNAT family N-acyltransferase
VIAVYSLRDVISDGKEDKVKSLLSSFRCSLDRDAERYLKEKAIEHDIRGISRTYLAVDEGETPEDDTVVGYFTVAVKCLSVKENHNISAEIADKMNIDRGTAQAYLLGQLAKADGTGKGFGKEMMDRAVDIFIEANRALGCRVIRLDCKDRLVGYYGECGFVPVGKTKDGILNQMIRILA